MKHQVKSSASKLKKILLTTTLFVTGGTIFYYLLARIGFLMPPAQISSVFCSACEFQQPIHSFVEGDQFLNKDKPLKTLLASNADPENVSILVEKSKYRLTLFYNLRPIKSYRVVFGENQSGDKLHEGDQKTPEGIFRVRDRYPHPSWSKFIWLDYPTAQSWREHFQAKLSGQVNWLLPVGGQIGIHGVPEGQDDLIQQRSNWTLGCISLKNSDVDEIYPFIAVGSVVEIVR